MASKKPLFLSDLTVSVDRLYRHGSSNFIALAGLGGKSSIFTEPWIHYALGKKNSERVGLKEPLS
jgi:hypothetical protein